ncbi:MAG: hypothetical protein ACRCZY_01550, partial [Phocaeicola sp.]
IKLYTTGQNAIVFSAKNGVYSNCKMRNSILLITEKNHPLGVGKVNVDTTLTLQDKDFDNGVRIIKDTKQTSIEIVSKNTSLQNDQGIKYIPIMLTQIVCSDSGQGMIEPAGITEQFVRDIIAKDLSDVNIEAKLKSLGYNKMDAQAFSTALANAPEMAELAHQSGVFGVTKINKDFSNVNPDAFNLAIQNSMVIKDLSKRVDLDEKEVRSSLDYQEQQEAANIKSFGSEYVYLTLQFTSSGQEIIQPLPSYKDGIKVLISKLNSDGVTNTKLTIKPAKGEFINGSPQNIEITENGLSGYFIPSQNGYEFLPTAQSHNYGIGFNKGNDSFANILDIDLEGGVDAVQDPISKNLVLTFPDKLEMVGTDGNKFTAKTLETMGLELRNSGTSAILVLPPSLPAHNEGIMLSLGTEYTLNSSFPNSRLYFGNTHIKGGEFVYKDDVKKSIIVQDIDPTDDPNQSGGTMFIVGMQFKPTLFDANSVSQKGSVHIQLVDLDNNVLADVSGKPIESVQTVNAGEAIKPMYYIGAFMAKEAKEVHMRVFLDFPSEEIVTVGSDTCLMLQSTSKYETSGLAMQEFTEFTGVPIRYLTRYYGENFFNFAQFNTQNMAKAEVKGFPSMGNNTYFSAVSKVNMEISGGSMIISDNGVDFPIWNVTQLITPFDAIQLENANVNLKVTLTNKIGAFKISLMRYDGSFNTPPPPQVVRYDNSVPVFTPDWTEVTSLYISEEPQLDEHSKEATWTLPKAQALAIVSYPATSESPQLISLKDIELDITPSVDRILFMNRIVINQNTTESKYHSELIAHSKGNNLRATVNDTWRHIALSDVQGDGNLFNNKIYDGTYGNIEAKADINYIRANYTVYCFSDNQTESSALIKLVKIGTDKSETEIVGSESAAWIPPKQTTPIKLSASATFELKKGESIMIQVKSDKTNGFYAESTYNNPMYTIDITTR